VLLNLIQLPLSWGQTDSTQTPISNWRSKQIRTQDTIRLDSLSVFPNSILLRSNNQLLPDSLYQVEGNRLIFRQKPSDSLLSIRYRVLPYALQKKRSHKNTTIIGKGLAHDAVIGTPYTYNPFNKGNEAFNFNDLDYSGVFARGISLGNNQDLILNSNFNLQLAGKLGDIEILGAISDNNLPLQPQGNTQQLQDFDRIFVQFKYKKQKLIAGDFDLKRPRGSYFMNYFRRLQGGQIFTDLKVGKKQRLKTDASFAVSKGKFARNVFQGDEGNQGPYRLEGANGEKFIIVIAGTERIFIDGKLLKRGADNDYIIDYNLGEITFTTNQLITKDKRIQVEFSYTDLTYLRTLATANTALENEHFTIRFNFYSEQDSKGQTASESLSDSAKAVLQRVGNDVDNAYVSGISIPDQTGENTGTVFYKMVDTIIGSYTFDSVLIYATGDSAIYAARFTEVSTGGPYIRVQGAANGVVYEWVGIDTLTGNYKGTHRPIQLLTTPKRQQLYNIGTDIHLGKNGTLSADFALSVKDNNTFSTVGNDNNQGIATRLTYNHEIPLTTDTTKNNNFIALKAHYEFLNARFQFVEPYRPREFTRDWNVSFATPTQEHLYKAMVRFGGRKWGQVSYEFNGLNKDTLYNGYKHILSINTRWKGLQFNSTSSLLQNQSTTEDGLFIRPKADLSYTFEKLLGWQIGAYYEQEYNRRLDSKADSLKASSFDYQVFKFYTKLPASDKLSLQAHYDRRYDYVAAPKTFVNSTVADDVNFGGHWEQSKSSKLQWNFNYRNLRVADSALTAQTPKETYLGRLEYVLNIKRGFIRSNTVYELGAGQQQKIEYNYVNVDKGQGTHIWVDRNGDEVEQTNEFEVANFQDQADYIRVTLLTGEFIKTNNVLFSQSLAIRPRVLIRSRKNKKKKLPWGLDFLQRLTSRSLFKIERKTFDGAPKVVAANPFQLNVADSSLVSVGSSIRNNIYFNRTGVYSIEFGQSNNQSKTLLTTGFVSRTYTEYLLRQRLNIKRSKTAGKKIKPFFRNVKLQAMVEAALGRNGNQSEFFAERNYAIDFYRIKPQFTFLYQRFLRIVLKYNFNYKENKIGDEELLRSHDITTEITFNRLSKTNIKASFSYVNLEFNGDLSTPVGYTMTAGLQKGNNYLWNVSINQSLSRNIQLTLTYEGRATGDAPVVHVGRAQIRANF